MMHNLHLILGIGMIAALPITGAGAQIYRTIGFPMVNEGAAYFATGAPNGFELAARIEGS